MPPQTLYPMLLDQMIDGRALVAEARKSGLDKDPAVQRQMAAAEDRALQTAMLSKEVGPRSPMRRCTPDMTRTSPASPARKRCMPSTSWWTTRPRRRRSSPSSRAARDFAALAKQYSKDPQRGAAGRRSGLLQEGRDGAGIRHRGLRACSPARYRLSRCTPSSAGTSSRWWSGAVPTRRHSSRRTTNCARR